MFNIPCIIFSGGRSSRMKEDKSLLPFAGFNTITEFQLSKLQKLFTTVYISCKNKDKFDFGANFIEDIKTDNIYAPTIGFVSAFQALSVESFFAISVDAPFVSGVEIGKIIESDSPDADATIAITEFGIQPMCGIYHRSLEDKFNTMLNDNNHKLGYLLKKSNTQYVMFKDEKVFLNLNHPHEYREALRLFTDEEYRNLEDIEVDEF